MTQEDLGYVLVLDITPAEKSGLTGKLQAKTLEVTATQEEAQAAADKKAQEEQDTEAQLEGSEEDAESEDVEDVQQTEDGYDHETTCTKAFTKERLEWVFAHELNNTPQAVKTVSSSSRAIKETQYFSIDGQRLQAPMSHGIYLQTIIYTDATSETRKIIAR